MHVQRSQLPSHIRTSHRTSPSVEVCVFSFVGNNYSYSSYIPAMIYVGHEAQPFNNNNVIIITIIIIIIIVQL